MVMLWVDALPAPSTARAVIVLAPMLKATFEIVHVPPATLSVALAPFTVTCDTPDAFCPVSVAVPLTVTVVDCVLEPLAGELIASAGDVVSAADCRVTVIVCVA